jgi:hypothetical protein
MKSKDTPLSRKDQVVVQNIDGEVLIYDLRDNKAFCLNETSAVVWQLCDGNKTVTQISKELGDKLNSPANEDLVWFAIDQLKKEKLIENSSELTSNFAGLSRREVIKRIGIGTAIALPIIASLVAPSAVFGQSCIANGGTTPNTSGTCAAGSNATRDAICAGACCTMMGIVGMCTNTTLTCTCTP